MAAQQEMRWNDGDEVSGGHASTMLSYRSTSIEARPIHAKSLDADSSGNSSGRGRTDAISTLHWSTELVS